MHTRTHIRTQRGRLITDADGSDDDDDDDDEECLHTDLLQKVMLSSQLPNFCLLLLEPVRKQQLIGRADARQRQEVGNVLYDEVVLLLRTAPPSQRHT